MIINKLLKERNMNAYKLSMLSGVPKTTIQNICSGHSELVRCNAGTVCKIAKALNVSVETLLMSDSLSRPMFENFKSTTCHRLKDAGDIAFAIEIIEEQEIPHLYYKGWIAECLYLLAMLDYVCRINNVPLCADYDEYRKIKFKTPLYPASLLAMYYVTKDKSILENALKEAIPEFKNFNIIENEVRNVA